MAKYRSAEYDAVQKRRSIIIASASSIFVVLALLILVPMTPGWEKVQKSFSKKFQPYVIGKISNHSKRVKTSGKIKW